MVLPTPPKQVRLNKEIAHENIPSFYIYLQITLSKPPDIEEVPADDADQSYFTQMHNNGRRYSKARRIHRTQALEHLITLSTTTPTAVYSGLSTYLTERADLTNQQGDT